MYIIIILSQIEYTFFIRNRSIICCCCCWLRISSTKLEQVQYKAALIVPGCWQGTSREKLYAELGWESLAERRWTRRLTLFYKIKNGLAPSYLSEHIPEHSDINIFF